MATKPWPGSAVTCRSDPGRAPSAVMLRHLSRPVAKGRPDSIARVRIAQSTATTGALPAASERLRCSVRAQCRRGCVHSLAPGGSDRRSRAACWACDLKASAACVRPGVDRLARRDTARALRRGSPSAPLGRHRRDHRDDATVERCQADAECLAACLRVYASRSTWSASSTPASRRTAGLAGA